MNESVSTSDVRRLEECSLNASGAFQSLVYDGWLLGYRPGPTKRLRCVNPIYPSTLPIAGKIDYCIEFYRAAGLPAIFRLVPFSQPTELDGILERRGWERFERTLVLRAELTDTVAPRDDDVRVIVDVATWVEATASLLALDTYAVMPALERAKSYPLPHAGAIVRRDGEVVACGLVKFENDYAGLFAVHTASAHRGKGLGRLIVAALLAEARARRTRTAYLQVTEANVAALALYRRFGFATAYDYWYRARSGEQK